MSPTPPHSAVWGNHFILTQRKDRLCKYSKNLNSSIALPFFWPYYIGGLFYYFKKSWGMKTCYYTVGHQCLWGIGSQTWPHSRYQNLWIHGFVSNRISDCNRRCSLITFRGVLRSTEAAHQFVFLRKTPRGVGKAQFSAGLRKPSGCDWRILPVAIGSRPTTVGFWNTQWIKSMDSKPTLQDLIDLY